MLIEQLSNTARLTSSEQQIAEFVLSYPQFVIDLPLAELAGRAYVSEASIIRFAKKLGCKGYADFKIRLARELDSFTGDRPVIPVDIPLASGSDVRTASTTMYDLSLQALEEARRELDLNLIQRAALIFQRSDFIRIYGRGESLVLAEDFHYKLLRIGVRSALSSPNGFQEAASLSAPRRGIKESALVISEYCNSHHVNYIVDELREAKIPFVLLTAAEEPWPYQRFAAVTLHYPSSESRHKMGSFASRTAALYVLDCLFATLFSLDYERNRDNLERASQRKVKREYFYRSK
jgi:DNA-binding MurR/RpiR family transcriptional regulator